MQSRQQGDRGSHSTQSRSPLMNPLTISDTRRVHSKSPSSTAAPLGNVTGKRENTPWNTAIDSTKPRSPSSPLAKPRVDANRMVKHESMNRCTSCAETLLQLKAKDKEVGEA